MPRTRRTTRAFLVAAALVVAAVLTGCGEDEPDAPLLAMPDLVGQPVLTASSLTYDALHTSLVPVDLAPANRESGADWVVVATSPAAGARTPKFTKVYAWVLKASEYTWFTEHPTMPRIPVGTDAAELIGKDGLLAPVEELVQLRYLPGAAPSSAKPSKVDAAAFTPDRGLHPDLATEPPAEFGARAGLLAAPSAGTVAAGSRPGAAAELRVGQYLVVLVKPKPVEKPRPPSTPDPITPATSGGSGGSGGGSTGGGGGTPSLPGGFPTKIPNCPRQLCG